MTREAQTDQKIDALWREATDIHGLTTPDQVRRLARKVAALAPAPAVEPVAWWLQGTDVVEFNKADKCETWLQSGGASNVVDALEAGYRRCESDHPGAFPASEQLHEGVAA